MTFWRKTEFVVFLAAVLLPAGFSTTLGFWPTLLMELVFGWIRSGLRPVLGVCAGGCNPGTLPSSSRNSAHAIRAVSTKGREMFLGLLGTGKGNEKGNTLVTQTGEPVPGWMWQTQLLPCTVLSPPRVRYTWCPPGTGTWLKTAPARAGRLGPGTEPLCWEDTGCPGLGVPPLQEAPPFPSSCCCKHSRWELLAWW